MLVEQYSQYQYYCSCYYYYYCCLYEDIDDSQVLMIVKVPCICIQQGFSTGVNRCLPPVTPPPGKGQEF